MSRGIRSKGVALKPSKLVLSLALSALLINQFLIDPVARELLGFRTGIGLEEPNALIAFLSSILILGVLLLGARGVERLLKAISENPEALSKVASATLERIPMGSLLFKILKAMAFKRR